MGRRLFKNILTVVAVVIVTGFVYLPPGLLIDKASGGHSITAGSVLRWAGYSLLLVVIYWIGGAYADWINKKGGVSRPLYLRMFQLATYLLYLGAFLVVIWFICRAV